MALLDGTLVLIIVLTGAAMLSPHHVVMLVAGLGAGAVALLVTYGHVVLRSRRTGRPVPAGRVSADRAAAGRAPVAAGQPAAGVVPAAGTLDVEPAEPLALAPMDGRTAASVILGAAGIFLFNPVFGAIAIGLGRSALRRGTPGRWGRPGAVAGIVLGIVDYLVLAVLIAGRVSSNGFHWG